ncbi:MAG: secondary thiamine-phosphate synthase enzyme YjbQ [Pseudomonadota bacterium]
MELSVSTRGPGFYEITDRVQTWLNDAGAQSGVVTLFVRHTSCSLLIQENADPDVQIDLAAFVRRLVPPADDPKMDYLRHRSEGPDDMPAHIKAALLPVSLQVPVAAGHMALGTWQGIYLIEHRDRPHQRRIALAFTAS